MNGPRFPTSKLAAGVLACSFHCMTAPGFDEALLVGVDLLGETLVRLGREELALAFTYVFGCAHGDRVPLLVKGVSCNTPEGDMFRLAEHSGASLRVHELLHDLLAPAPKEELTYGGRMALGAASAVALVGGDGGELREVWQGFFEDAPQQERMLTALRALQGLPQGAGRHLGSTA